MKVKKNILIVLSLLFIIQVKTNAQEDDNKTLDGIGKYIIGKTTSELFDGVKIKTTLKTQDLPKGVYYIIPSPLNKLDGKKEYKHICYKVNDKIKISLNLKFFNDTLYFISTNTRYNSYVSSRDKKNNVDLLLKGLAQSGYISNESSKSERDPYINRFGGIYYSYFSSKEVTYKSKPNINASGSSSKSDDYYLEDIWIFDKLINNRVSYLEELERNKKPLPDKDLIKGL
jgi:hypothetical protein